VSRHRASRQLGGGSLETHHLRTPLRGWSARHCGAPAPPDRAVVARYAAFASPSAWRCSRSGSTTSWLAGARRAPAREAEPAGDARDARPSSRSRSGKTRRISSSLIPLARYARTSPTVIRRPRMHGRPPRLPSSIVILDRQSSRALRAARRGRLRVGPRSSAAGSTLDPHSASRDCEIRSGGCVDPAPGSIPGASTTTA
jgi:hypothetical protein